MCREDSKYYENFYSHAREGRDWIEGECLNGTSDISTHTPARGVTALEQSIITDKANFYSHAREGRDSRDG